MYHDSLVVEKIRNLRIKGFTLSEIITKTGLSKTTIFYHIKKIPQSSKLKEKLRISKLKNQRNTSSITKGKTRKTYIFSKPNIWSSDLVRVVSHFLFDGNLQKTWVGYNSRNKVLIELVAEKVSNLFKITDYKTYINNLTKVVRIAYHNVEFAVFIKNKSIDLLQYVVTAKTSHKISFLKAFFDDEGSVKFKNRDRSIRGYQRSIEILNIVKVLLGELGIESKIDEKYFEIKISQKENLIKFQKIINFTEGVQVNGQRNNSVWKKSMEKREIVKMAVDSYKVNV